MAITAQSLVKHELTGLLVQVVESTDSNKIGLSGKIIGETKNLIKIETVRGEKSLPKKECVFRFTIEGKKIDVQGEKLLGRPEERIKGR